MRLDYFGLYALYALYAIVDIPMPSTWYHELHDRSMSLAGPTLLLFLQMAQGNLVWFRVRVKVTSLHEN